MTIAQAVSPGALSVKLGDVTYECANTDTDQCTFGQAIDQTPYLTTITLTDSSTVTLDGSGFLTSDYTPHFTFLGIQADSVSVSSDVSASVTFTNGVPVSDTAELPVFQFTSDTDGHVLYSSNDQTI